MHLAANSNCLYSLPFLHWFLALVVWQRTRIDCAQETALVSTELKDASVKRNSYKKPSSGKNNGIHTERKYHDRHTRLVSHRLIADTSKPMARTGKTTAEPAPSSESPAPAPRAQNLSLSPRHTTARVVVPAQPLPGVHHLGGHP